MLVIRYELEDISGLSDAISALSKAPANKLKKILNQWRFTLANNINKSLSGDVLQKRTKQLFNSVSPHQNLTIVETSESTFTVSLKNKIVVYAMAQEKGAVITPKTKTWLTIPLRKGNGNARPIPITRYKNKFFLKSKSNPDELVAYWRKAKKEVVPIFVLKKKVVLQPRPWFKEAVERSIPNFIKQVESA